MNIIQLGKATLPAAGLTAGQTAPKQGASGPRETAAPPALEPAQAEATAQAPLSSDAVKKVASQINDFLKSSSSNLQFSVDDSSSKVVVRIVDSQTNELIRQIPSEEMLAISRSLDQMIGLLIKQKA
ncbi:MAG: flagellar protein FlaG [Proteobacteria bacterium]|nr:flagellar protein FlaG [Pseudomonadota bacterium]